MDSKGLITPRMARGSAARLVPLFICESMCWTADKTCTATYVLPTHSPAASKAARWHGASRAVTESRAIASGKDTIESAGRDLSDVGSISTQLPASDQRPTRCCSRSSTGRPTATVTPSGCIPTGRSSTSRPKADAGVTVTRTLDRATLAALDRGEVLPYARPRTMRRSHGREAFSDRLLELRMFKSICDKHAQGRPRPARSAYSPTPRTLHSRASRPTSTPTGSGTPSSRTTTRSHPRRHARGYRPTVQVIDNISQPPSGTALRGWP